MDIESVLDGFTPKQMDFVTYRMAENANAPAYRKAGYNEKSWYKLPADLRREMGDAALALARDGKLRAIRLLQDEMEGAAERIVGLSKHADKDSVKLRANSEILSLGGIVARKQVDITTGGDAIGIQTIEVIKDYGPPEDD